MTQLTKICSKNIVLLFPLSYEIVISECSLNVQIIFWMFKKFFSYVNARENFKGTFNVIILQTLWESYFECYVNHLKLILY